MVPPHSLSYKLATIHSLYGPVIVLVLLHSAVGRHGDVWRAQKVNESSRWREKPNQYNLSITYTLFKISKVALIEIFFPNFAEQPTNERTPSMEPWPSNEILSSHSSTCTAQNPTWRLALDSSCYVHRREASFGHRRRWCRFLRSLAANRLLVSEWKSASARLVRERMSPLSQTRQ